MDRRGVAVSSIDSSLEVFFAVRGLLLVSPFIARRSPSDSEVLDAMESRDGWFRNFLVEPERRFPSAWVADFRAVLGPFDEELDIDR